MIRVGGEYFAAQWLIQQSLPNCEVYVVFGKDLEQIATFTMVMNIRQDHG
jgi:hypothetical protein